MVILLVPVLAGEALSEAVTTTVFEPLINEFALILSEQVLIPKQVFIIVPFILMAILLIPEASLAVAENFSVPFFRVVLELGLVVIVGGVTSPAGESVMLL